MRKLFPNLFIIGAMKAATSSLHEYLRQHPQIFMSRRKEPEFFARDRDRAGTGWGGAYSREMGLDEYLRLFASAGDAAYAGESSTGYTKEPQCRGCAGRIHAFNREARLIYLLRDPVERALSHYWYQLANHRETRGLLRAVQTGEEYVAFSDYARQLRPYLSLFGRERIFILTTEELQRDPQASLAAIFRWLGVDAAFRVLDLTRYNQTPRRVRCWRWPLRHLAPVQNHWRWRRYAPLVPRVIRKVAAGVGCMEVDRSQVDVSLAAAHLRAALLHRAAELENMIGRAFPEWTTLYA